MKIEINRNRVRVSERVIEKASRLFNASLTDILNELLQNARRAGASMVVVRAYEERGEQWLSVEDDGCGIFASGEEIVFGKSGWSEQTQESEDPAGMGIFSLAHRGATFEASRIKVTLTPSQFAGREDYTVERGDRSVGTKVTFILTKDEHREVEEVTSTCAMYYPLHLLLNGNPVLRSPFFGSEVLYRESWNGVEIGVQSASRVLSEINFYGVVVQSKDLPSVKMENLFPALAVRVDVIDAPELKLVLPARKEVHQDEFFKRLQNACYATLYRYVGTLSSHSLRYKDWIRAKALGIPLPEAEAKLRTFEFPKGYDWYGSENDFEDCRGGAIVSAKMDSIEARAIERGFLLGDDERRLYQQCESFVGYSWYSQMPRYTDFEVVAAVDGETLSIKDTQSQDITRPDRLIVRGTLVHSDGRIEVDEFDTDLAFSCDEDHYWGSGLEGAHVLLTKTSKMSESDLVEELTWALFYPNEDYNADSVETQLDEFEGDAYALATSLLRSEDDALKERVYGLIERYVRWLVPEDKRIDVVVKGRDRSIEVSVADE